MWSINVPTTLKKRIHVECCSQYLWDWRVKKRRKEKCLFSLGPWDMLYSSGIWDGDNGVCKMVSRTSALLFRIACGLWVRGVAYFFFLPINHSNTSHHGHLWAHVFGRGQAVLSSKCATPPWHSRLKRCSWPCVSCGRWKPFALWVGSCCMMGGPNLRVGIGQE